jgi:hypothetical protein
MEEYDDYDEKMKEIKKKNDVYLKEFIEDLTKEGLKENRFEGITKT